MELFSALPALCEGNSPSPVNSPHKGQWRGALMFSLICAWTHDCVNNRDAGDLIRHRTHYDVTVMHPFNRPNCLWLVLYIFANIYNLIWKRRNLQRQYLNNLYQVVQYIWRIIICTRFALVASWYSFLLINIARSDPLSLAMELRLFYIKPSIRYTMATEPANQPRGYGWIHGLNQQEW